MNINYCANCGAKITEGASFCSECGSKIERTEVKSLSTKDVVNSKSESIHKEESTSLEKKKKKGLPRTLGKVALWVFGILVLAIVSLYFIGDAENSTELEVDSNNNVEQSDQVDSYYENKHNSYKALKESKGLKKAADKMEDIFKEADTTELKLMLTDTSLKKYNGVYAQIQPYMDEYAKAFKNRKLEVKTKVYSLYSFKDSNGEKFTVEFAQVEKGVWKLVRF